MIVLQGSSPQGVYTLWSERERSLLFATEEDKRTAYGGATPLFLGKPLETWHPLRLIAEADKLGIQVGDFTFCHAIPNFPAFSSRAVDAMHDVLERFGQLLPLETDVGPYWAYNVTNVIDVLDRQASKIKMFKGRILEIERMRFRQDAIEGQFVFKIPETVGSAAYVTEAFRSIVHRSGLSGFFFRVTE